MAVVPEHERRRPRRGRKRPRRVLGGRPDRPLADGGELAQAPGEWARPAEQSAEVNAHAQTKGVALSAADVERATRDSIRALMLIRAYRARGHFHANLDRSSMTLRRRTTRRSLIRAPTGSPSPISTARSFSTTCSASNSHATRDHRHPATHLLPDAGRRISAHLRWRAERLV